MADGIPEEQHAVQNASLNPAPTESSLSTATCLAALEIQLWAL